MQETLTVVIALLIGLPVVVAVLHDLSNDGYGRRTPPRSHRDEVALTQHEKLRRLPR